MAVERPVKVTTIERNPFIEVKDLDSRSDKEILLSGERRKRTKQIRLSHVDTEDAIVDDLHAKDLGDDISKNGQDTPITVRARVLMEPAQIQGHLIEAGEVVYDIADGFHRSITEIAKESETINASILYGCTDEELLDKRILAAGSRESVQIPRIAAWVTKEFNKTVFAQKEITPFAAFEYMIKDTKPVTRLIQSNLSEEERVGLIEWIREKCEIWDKNPISILDILRVVRDADPELVKKIRTGKRIPPDAFTKAVVVAVANQYPSEGNYHVQRAILAAAKTRNLNQTNTSKLIGKLPAYLEGRPYDEIYDLAMSVEIEDVVFQRRRHRLSTQEAHGSQTPHTTAPIEIKPQTDNAEFLELIRLSAENASLTEANRLATDRITELEEVNRTVQEESSSLKEADRLAQKRILELEEQNRRLQEDARPGADSPPEGTTLIDTGLLTKLHDAAWWLTLETLTEPERLVMQWYVDGTLEDMIAKGKIAKDLSIKLSKSAHGKRQTSTQQQEETS